jgi:hypothetical protein
MGTAEKVREMDAIFPWAMGSCITWAMMDRVAYEMGSRDHFVFDVSQGKATALEAVGYAVKMVRETTGDSDSGDANTPRATETQTGSGPAETVAAGGAGRQGIAQMAAVVVGVVVTVMVGGSL